MRSSLSCARRRRLRCLPRPGGLLDQQPPVARLGGDDRLDAALGDDRVHLLAQAGVRQHLEHVDEPAARAVERGTRPRRCGRAGAAIEISPTRQVDARRRRCRARPRPRPRARACTPWPPAKITSCIDCPRTASGDCSPMRPQHGVGDVRLARAVRADDHATRRAPNSSRVRSGNDLKPFRVSDFRCIGAAPHAARARSSAARAASCSASFLRAPGAAPELLAVDDRARPRRSGRAAGPSRRSPRRRRRSPRRARRSCSADLKSTGCSSAVLDLRLERLDHRLGGRARSRSAGSRRRSPPRSPRRARARCATSAVGALADAVGRGRPQPLGHAEPLGDRAARRRPTPPARGSSSAARRRSARPPAAGTGASVTARPSTLSPRNASRS